MLSKQATDQFFDGQFRDHGHTFELGLGGKPGLVHSGKLLDFLRAQFEYRYEWRGHRMAARDQISHNVRHGADGGVVDPGDVAKREQARRARHAGVRSVIHQPILGKLEDELLASKWFVELLCETQCRGLVRSREAFILFGVVANAVSLQLANLTGAEADVIERCCMAARGHTDYSANTNGARLFDTVLLWLVRFIFNRLELTKGDDPTGAYLFERNDGSLPHEDELQQDFFRWVATYAAASDLEPTNIASGRADIRLRC